MKLKELREECAIPSSAISDTNLHEIQLCAYETVDTNLDLIKFNLACFEIARRIGDDKSMQFYKNKILGKLGVITKD
jgi:hypothetical protein